MTDSTFATPADSAFVSGTTVLPASPSGTLPSGAGQESCLTDALPVLCILMCLLAVRKIAGLFPSMIGILVRWKESVNIENSMKLRRDRNIVAAIMTLPFCLVVSFYRVYDPAFMGAMSPSARLCVTAGVVLGYILLREAVFFTVRPRRIRPKEYSAAHCSQYTFFICVTSVILLSCGVLSFCGVCGAVIKTVILYELLAFYALAVFREWQILGNSCSLFSAFLYLCTLEILPTGLVVASAMLL